MVSGVASEGRSRSHEALLLVQRTSQRGQFRRKRRKVSASRSRYCYELSGIGDEVNQLHREVWRAGWTFGH